MFRYSIIKTVKVICMVLLIETIASPSCMATPTKVNTNKNSMANEHSYPSSRRVRVTLITPDADSVSEDETEVSVSEDLIKQSETVSDDSVEQSRSLSSNEVKYTSVSPKYSNIALLHLPYDEYMRLNAAWFYKTGMYERQGVNSFNYRGTCSEAAEATVMNRIFDTNVYTENNMLAFACMCGTCTVGADLRVGGAQSAVQMTQNFNSIGNVTGDKVEANYLTNSFVPDPERTAELLVSGNQIIMSVAPCVLWDYPKDESIASGIDYWSPDHWIVVTAPKYNNKGKLIGFYIADSSGYGANYLTLSKYKSCVWGPTGKEVYNQACVIIKREE